MLERLTKAKSECQMLGGDERSRRPVAGDADSVHRRCELLVVAWEERVALVNAPHRYVW